MRYKGTKKGIRDIGRELNVDAVVEGTVTRSGDRVRITAQLIQVATDMHLWAETYERDVREVLRLQNEVATDIARRISSVVKPLDQPRTVNPQAYGLYLKGRDFFYRYTDQGWQQSIEHFNQAIEADPNFAPAYFRPRRRLSRRRHLRRHSRQGSVDSRKNRSHQSAATGRQPGQRSLRARDRLYLVRLGLGKCGEGISTRPCAQSQRCPRPQLARRLPVSTRPPPGSDRRARARSRTRPILSHRQCQPRPFPLLGTPFR